MTPVKATLVFIAALLALPVSHAQGLFAQDSDQQINDFSLAGFGERGKKTWDISGKTADIFNETIKLKDIIGNLYGDKENIKLTADKGDFDKIKGKVHLEQNVVVTTTSGARLLTDSLDWDRKNQTVATKDLVNIERDNILATAQGATGHPNLKQVTLEKDVTVNIAPQENQKKPEEKNKTKTVITCDGPLLIDYDKSIATFSNNVKVDRGDIQIYSDLMDVYFLPSGQKEKKEPEKTEGLMGNKIDKIVARGNAKIVRGDNISYSDQVIYTASDRKITLLGKPKLVIYSTEGMNASVGN